MVVHGAQRRPRALFENLDKELVKEFASMVGSFEEVSSGVESVDEREYDILITASDTVARREHLHVLAFGVRDAASVVVPKIERGPRPANVPTSAPINRDGDPFRKAFPFVVDDVLARQLDIPRSVNGTLRELVMTTLIPVIEKMSMRPRWTVDSYTPSYAPLRANFAEFKSGVQTLLSTHSDREILAFCGFRSAIESQSKAKIVALPVMPLEPGRWLRWFLEDLRGEYPDLFPVNEDWRTQGKWTPPELRQALDAREQLKAKRTQVLAQLEREESAAQAAVETSTRVAESTHWRLVTEQGAILESAVTDAFETLGFNVESRDRELAPGEPKLEDLRLTDDECPGWVALVEVKGFEKGASPKGATQLAARPVVAYIKESGERPGALYYVVNHDMRLPPPERPTALQGDSAVDLLGEYDGALIDTQDLLAAVVAVLNDSSEAPSIRQQIRESRGRWQHMS